METKNVIEEEFFLFLDKRVQSKVREKAQIDSTVIPVLSFLITGLVCLFFRNDFVDLIFMLAVLCVLLAMGMSIHAYEPYLKLFKSASKTEQIKSLEFIKQVKEDFITLEIERVNRGLEFVRNNSIVGFMERNDALQKLQLS